MTDDAPTSGTGRTPSGEPDPTTGAPGDAPPPGAVPSDAGADAPPPPPAAGTTPSTPSTSSTGATGATGAGAGSVPDGGAGPVSEPAAGSEEPPPPPFPTTDTVYIAGQPQDPDAVPVDLEAETAGFSGALAALGSGLLGAGVVISSFRARSGEGEELDWSVYAAGLCALAGLLGLSLVVAFLVRRGGRVGARADLITWPGAVGILGLGLALPVGLSDTDLDGQLTYVVGGVITVLSLAWFAIARRPAFAVTAIVGLGLLYAEGFREVFADDIDGPDAPQWIALAVTAFVVVVTLVGWLLPSRTITGVAVGVVGVVGIAVSLLWMLALRLFATLFADSPLAGLLPSVLGTEGAEGAGGLGGLDLGGISAVPADYESDVAVVLAYAAGLALLWAVAAIVSNHSGFKILAITILATAVPLGTMVLAVEHPTWWVVALGGAGGVVLLAALPFVRRRARAQRLAG